VSDEFEGDDFSDVRWSGRELVSESYVDCKFQDADLTKIVTHGCTFTNCDFTGADLDVSRHAVSAFIGCRFEKTGWRAAALTGCKLIGSVFIDCRCTPWNVRDCDLSMVSFGGAALKAVDFSGLRMREANLVDADLSHADLRGADLRGARLANTKLFQADLRGAELDATAWQSAILTGARIDVQQAVGYALAHGLVFENSR
jgi:uncharacterized protein YjbI with pentapeptide repeats